MFRAWGWRRVGLGRKGPGTLINWLVGFTRGGRGLKGFSRKGFTLT